MRRFRKSKRVSEALPGGVKSKEAKELLSCIDAAPREFSTALENDDLKKSRDVYTRTLHLWRTSTNDGGVGDHVRDLDDAKSTELDSYDLKRIKIVVSDWVDKAYAAVLDIQGTGLVTGSSITALTGGYRRSLDNLKALLVRAENELASKRYSESVKGLDRDVSVIANELIDVPGER